MNFIKNLLGTGAAALMLGTTMAPVFADAVSVNFEPPTYATGTINGQNGWSKTGPYDVAVVSSPIYGYPLFGAQSLRISDEFTSGAFGDQTFAPPLTNAVGEAGSTDGSFSRGTIQRHFETQFDIASTIHIEQVGMHLSVSPDRGDGSRMSYLRFDDKPTGIDVFFDDVQQTSACSPAGCANFVETPIGTLTRTVPHTIKLTMDLLDGPGNDVVKVYIDGILVKTGTSWEDYYRYDPEASAEQSPRIIKTVLFRESAVAHPANAGNGFLIDNFSTFSGPILVGPPTNKDQCKKDGWKTFNNPTFKNQGECVSFVEHLNENGHNQDHDQCDRSAEHLNKEEHNHNHDHD
jgi:hypothetical protein